MTLLFITCVIIALLLLMAVRLDVFNNFTFTNLLAILTVLNLLSVFITFGITMNGPGGEVGMLPFVVLPYVGILTIILLVNLIFASLIIKKSILKKTRGIALILFLLFLCLIEMSPILIIG